MRTTTIITAALAALALSACAVERSPAASAVPPVTVESLIYANTYLCPELDPAQSLCRVPR